MPLPSPAPDVTESRADGAAGPSFDEGDVCVWHVRADSLEPADAWRVLSDDERSHAERFRFARDRDRFTVCRAHLRRILGNYLNQPPEKIRFELGPHGKPRLSAAPRASRICFNVTHSRDDALIAVANGREVGIDLEHLRDDLDPLKLASRFLTPGENEFIARHSPEERIAAFLTCWTRKEAWMKAVGVGLTKSLSHFDVTPSLGQRSATLGPLPGSADLWTVHELQSAPGAIAAIVVRGAASAVPPVRVLR